MVSAAAALLACAAATTGIPKPSAQQARMLETPLAMFMHYSVDPYTSIEHNCVGIDKNCIPASVFNPDKLSTDAWVEAAVAFGAGEICLTAHHEGGFCLWDTKYSNYSVMHSPYGRDIVAQFVASCKKYNVKPCYYMGPNANGYLSNNQSLSADAFVTAQLGMLRELLTGYGSDYVSRLWWDHYPSGCGGLAPCPSGSFPDAWPRFVQLVRDLSPSTVICPGPDCDGHQGEGGVVTYPAWSSCIPAYSDDGTELRCTDHAPAADADHTGFHPYETCATMHNGWSCKGNCTGGNNIFWTPARMFDSYMASVGTGGVSTLNAPPGTTGEIAPELVANMKVFGGHLRGMLARVNGRAAAGAVTCGTGGASDALELQLGGGGRVPVHLNASIVQEDLAAAGQVVAAYDLDYYDDAAGTWAPLPHIPGPQIPATPRRHCGASLDNVNLVSSAPPTTHFIKKTPTAADCAAICAADAACNFYTWHDANQGAFANKCYVRYDSCFDYKEQAGHFSGVCNATLTSTDSSCGSSTAGCGVGVHGKSVGARTIDLLPDTTTSAIRFRCTKAVDGVPAGTQAVIKSFSAHVAVPPEGSTCKKKSGKL